jgi:hypothetical protein
MSIIDESFSDILRNHYSEHIKMGDGSEENFQVKGIQLDIYMPHI